MTDLRNVWIQTQHRELIRADRIVSLRYGHSGGTSGVIAQVFAGYEQDIGREVAVLACRDDEAGRRAVAELAIALGRAADWGSGALFVYPGKDAGDDRPAWQVSAEPPPVTA